MKDEHGGVCIVTQPERSRTGKEHARDLADIIAEVTAVTILTANLPADSRLREDHDVVEYSASGTGRHVLVEALRFLWNQFRLCRAVYSHDEEVMFFFGTTAYLLPVAFSRLLGKTVVVLPRGDVPLSLRLRWEESLPSILASCLARTVETLERGTYRLADAIVTYTPAMARELGLEPYGNKLYTDGARFVDTERFDRTVPFPERDRCVGYVGRLDVEKRVPELATAAGCLRDGTTFVFVGDGDFRELLETELAAELEDGTVELVGWVDREEVPAQLNRLRLLVVPSHPTEGLPTTILEAMACGTPVYATAVSGVPDGVRHGETGFLTDDVDGETVATDVENILDREDLREISTNCRTLVEEEFSFEAAVNRYEAILDAVT